MRTHAQRNAKRNFGRRRSSKAVAAAAVAATLEDAAVGAGPAEEAADATGDGLAEWGTSATLRQFNYKLALTHAVNLLCHRRGSDRPLVQV